MKVVKVVRYAWRVVGRWTAAGRSGEEAFVVETGTDAKDEAQFRALRGLLELTPPADKAVVEITDLEPAGTIRG